MRGRLNEHCLGERTISMDELTGVQAIERKFPDLPMQPGHVLRREFEYIRHGTLTWFINFDVVTGQIVVPSWGPTRTEEDALAHLQRLIASDPEATRLSHHGGQPQYPSVGSLGALDCSTGRHRAADTGDQRQERDSSLDGKSGGLFA
jgi:hypothetical protein